LAAISQKVHQCIISQLLIFDDHILDIFPCFPPVLRLEIRVWSGRHHDIPARFISKQLDTVLDDLIPHAVKIGMLHSGAAVREVARAIERHGLKKVVVDPVLKASTGKRLLEPEAISLLKEVLFPVSSVVTPNLYEAGVLAGRQVDDLNDMAAAAKIIKAAGPDVVVTGGHLKEGCVDLFYDGEGFHRISGSRIDAQHTHGSGCVFSTALATFLAETNDIHEAAKLAHALTRQAIVQGYACGGGAGPVRPGFQST